ncbi:MAG: M13 family metallopeptidase [Odoribacteraceae bacterium]|nr:M13 family metallopeptidase [Odoribacteraceae bacterium]
MKKRVCISCIAMMMIGWIGKKDESTSGIILSNLDTTALPGADFYRYACGGWMEKHPLVGEYSRFGSFDQLAEDNRGRLKALIEEMAAKESPDGTAARKVGDLYSVAMDSAKLNREGFSPIRAALEEIAALRDKKELPAFVARARRAGFAPYFSLYIGADAGNSEMNIANTYQDGLSLGEREYYLDQDAHAVKIREAFREHVAGMFRLAGFTRKEAKRATSDVMHIETRLATAFRSAAELRDPRANYNKMTVAELQREAPGIDWSSYFSALGLPGLQELNAGQPGVLRECAAILGETSLEMQKSYLRWKVIDAAAAYLSDEISAKNFDFYGKTLSGKLEQQPRWKRSVSTVDNLLGEIVGQLYVEKYFPAAAKERMVALVQNLRESLAARIKGLGWMSDETKGKALEKLDAIRVKVGYPDAWRDYSALEIKRDSYWENIARANAFEYDYMLSKAGKPVDKEEWLMTPQTVNAYYNPTTNEICFPAGILQYPFFDMQADDAFNYGAIGVVIGHEMTHGFDDQGRQFDKNGNLKDWWSADDDARFEERARVLVDHFNAIEVLPGLNANGELTLGENIADLGGIQVAYTALQNAMNARPLEDKEGFSPAQRFFLAYSALWASNIRDEQVRVLTRSDPHSLGRWRVNGTLPHVNAWYEAFRVTAGSPLFLPEGQRAAIW